MVLEQELQNLIQRIPDLRWIRVVRVDGSGTHLTFRFDAGHIKRDTPADIYEDRYSSMTAASLSLNERIAYQLVLGKARYSVIAGEIRTYIFLLIGDGTEWVMSIGVQGNPPIDPIIRYFAERDYLAHIVPHLNI